MDALMDQAAVIIMAAMMAWPAILVAVLLPLILAAVQWRRGGWASARRSRAAYGGFVLGLVAGAPGAFVCFGGGVGDLRYWLDWVAAAAFALGTGVYFGLIAYLAAGVCRRITRIECPPP